MGREDRTLKNLRGISTTLEKPIKIRVPHYWREDARMRAGKGQQALTRRLRHILQFPRERERES